MDISIIIPAWCPTQKHLDWLDACLSSCKGQGIPIVVSDGSPLSISPLCEHHGVLYAEIPHEGKSAARNKAVSLAPTEMIYPLDADDFLTPNALSTLAGYWKGTPLYHDLWKWYNENKQVYHEMPNFSCHRCASGASLASVCVLHTKEQHKALGGWPVGIQLYEDWIYTSKLFWLFGGERIGKPLVCYRQHPDQTSRTDKNEALANAYAKAEIKRYAKETDDMACCGGKRRKPVSSTTATLPRSAASSLRSASSAVVLQDERSGMFGFANAKGPLVLVKYVGGPGRGGHIYRGINTRYPYKVRAGVQFKAALDDSIDYQTYKEGRTRSKLIRVDTIPVEQVIAEPQPARAPLPDTQKYDAAFLETQPVAPPPPPAAPESTKSEVVTESALEPPDLSLVDIKVSKHDIEEVGSLTIKDMLTNYQNWSTDTILRYLKAEQEGKNRQGAIKLLEKALNG